MNPSSYGDNCAEFYDEIYGPPHAAVVRALTRFARGGSVLELGIATGRTGLALAEEGLPLTGIESSSAMLAQLRGKPGVHGIRIVEGDFATVRLAEKFDLVFAITNTFSLLETQHRQIQCLHNVSNMLKSDGVFVMEVFRPCDGDGEVTEEGVRLNFRHELNTKLGRRFYEGRMLCPQVEVLNGLASGAGLSLKERFGDWHGSAYQPAVGNHVSVYGLA